jgi:DNA-binding NarL/FixJ family response regulator
MFAAIVAARAVSIEPAPVSHVSTTGLLNKQVGVQLGIAERTVKIRMPDTLRTLDLVEGAGAIRASHNILASQHSEISAR